MSRFRGRPRSWALVMYLLSGSTACSDPGDLRISVVRVQPEAAPDCGAPDDARTMILRALGEFPASEATAQSIELGSSGTFNIERFPESTRMLEAEVRGFGGALRTVGRTAEFSLAELDDGEEISLFMAPLEGVCGTGPAQVVRNRPMLARAGDSVLVVGGTEENGDPSPTVELYRPTEGRFEEVDASTYGDTSALGLEGASITTLANGDVAVVGGAATAFQVFEQDSEQFSAPSFYREARGRHTAVRLPDGRLFLAAGCSQIGARGCVTDAELRTSSILDLATGEIIAGPSLQLERVDGTAWLESPEQVVLVGGEDGNGDPVLDGERVFLDGRPSELIVGLAGASAQVTSGAIWAGFTEQAGVGEDALSVLGPGGSAATLGLQAALADSGVSMVALDDGSLLVLGEGGAQRVRTSEGEAVDLGVEELQGRQGHSATKLDDGSVLITGGRQANGDAAPALVFRPSLLGPHSASSVISFSSLQLSEGLSARNPGSISAGFDEGSLEIQLDDDYQYVLVAGPRPRAAQLQAAAAIAGDGSLQLYFGWESFANHFVIDVAPGAVPVAKKVAGGESLEVGEGAPGSCAGEEVGAEELSADAGVHEVELTISPTTLEVTLAGRQVLQCTLEEVASAGLMGVGAASQGQAQLRLDLISLSR